MIRNFVIRNFVPVPDTVHGISTVRAWHHVTLRGHQGSYVASPLLGNSIILFHVLCVTIRHSGSYASKDVYFQ